MTGLVIGPEPFESPDAQRLIGELDASLAALYRPEQRFGGRFQGHLAAPGRGAFLVARLAGEAVATGAYALLDPATAEVKRMYTAPAARGRGGAGAMLARLEALAREAGVTRLVLETGIHQQAAIRLYLRSGFRPVDCWGDYAGVETSVCYAKDLAEAGPG